MARCAYGLWTRLRTLPEARKKWSTSSIWRAATSVTLISLLAGCGVTHDQATAVAGFASSASTLATGVKSVYAQGGNDIASLDSESFVIPREGLAERVRQRKFQDPASFHGPLAPANLQGRIDAASALDAYGKALSILIDASAQDSQYSTAVSKLTGALKSIPLSTLKDAKITPAQIAGLGSVLIAVGNTYLDWRRRQTLEAVVPATSPIIGRLCRMFGHDFDSDKLDSYAGVYVRTAGKNEADASGALSKNADSLQARAILMPMYRHARMLDERSDSLFKPLEGAATACDRANAALAASIADPKVSLSDIRDFVKEADSAFSAIQATIGK